MLRLYTLFISIFYILYSPFYLVGKKLKGERKNYFKERMGFYSQEIKKLSKYSDTILIHAVSVGEVVAAVPLAKTIVKKWNNINIVISTVTPTGRQMAKIRIPEANNYIYFPFDLKYCIKKMISTIKPRLVIIMETELWPNFIEYLNYMKIPIIISNGRISDNSYRGYMFIRPWLKKILGKIDYFTMQTELDAKRIREIGAPAERIRTTGNMKFDILDNQAEEDKIKGLSKILPFSEEDIILTGGSTHKGEEKIILETYIELKQKNKILKLILAPRHPERLYDVENLIHEMGLKFIKRSNLPSSAPVENNILLIDTIGELSLIYRFSTIVFIGGSLVPVGGHNILEAARYSKPVIFGPYMSNFRYSSELLLSKNGAIQIKNGCELSSVIDRLLKNPEEAKFIGRNAYKCIEDSQGATSRNLEIIQNYLN